MNNCNDPNKLTIITNVTTIKTPYGDPKQDIILSSSHSYYIKPNKSLILTWYVKPSLVYHNQILLSGSFDVSCRLREADYSSDDGTSILIAGRKYKIISTFNSGDYDEVNQVMKNNFPITESHSIFI